MPPVTIRSATETDAAAVLDLWRAAETTVSVTDTPEQILVALGQPGCMVLVGEVDGVLVGTLIATFDGWRGNMYRLAVLPPFRRRGIARQLVVEGERRLVALGARRITALVEREHDWATGFWGVAGYTFDAGMARYYHNVVM